MTDTLKDWLIKLEQKRSAVARHRHNANLIRSPVSSITIIAKRPCSNTYTVYDMPLVANTFFQSGDD